MDEKYELSPEVIAILCNEGPSNPDDALNHSVTLSERRRKKRLSERPAPVDPETLVVLTEIFRQRAEPKLQPWQRLIAIQVLQFYGEGHMMVHHLAALNNISVDSATFAINATTSRVREIMTAPVPPVTSPGSMVVQ